MGAGLPSNLNSSRLARRLEERGLPRVASLTEAMAQGFEPVKGESGMWRRAHALWHIRTAEDGDGYVIVRVRDEPAPGIEPRRAAVEVKVRIEDDEEPESEVELVPADMPGMPREEAIMFPLGEIHIAQQLAPGQYVPEGGGAPRPYDPPTSMGHETDFGELIEVTQSFRPILYGGELVIPEGRLFEVSGQHPGDPEADQAAAPNITNPMYPEEDDEPGNFVRIRLQDDLTGAEISVLPLEFERFLSPRGSYPKQPERHRSKPRPVPQDAPATQTPSQERGVGPDQDAEGIERRETETGLSSLPRDETVPSRPTKQ